MTAPEFTVVHDPVGGMTLVCDLCGHAVVEYPAPDGRAGTSAPLAEIVDDANDHARDHD